LEEWDLRTGIRSTADSETFNNFSFRLNNNNNEGIDIKLETMVIISNFVVYRKIKTISINICDKFWTIFSIDENNRLLIARQICLLIGETLRSFLFTIFFSNEFSRRGCSSAYLYEKSFVSPWYGWQTTVFDSASDGTLIIKQQNFLTCPLQKVLRANDCQIICLAPDMGVCTNRRFVLTKIIISII